MIHSPSRCPIDSSGRLDPAEPVEPVWRIDRRSDHQEPDILLRRLPGNARRRTRVRLLRVPTAAERTGDLSASGGATPARTSTIPPAAQRLPIGQPFQGTSSRLTGCRQPAIKLLGYLPLPNIAGVAPTDPNYSASGSGIFNGNVFNIRIDHFQSEKLPVFGRYTFSNS